jgi:CDP-diacylglycerol--serine O-phosphatidyltransferase
MIHIPNLITCLNLAAGFISIVYAAQGDLVTSSWFIVAAMIFDFLDGFSARLLKAYSEIGKELDSLADVVSFGVAPGFIIYKLISGSYQNILPYFSGFESAMIVAITFTPLIMPVCAALRLAIFNLDSTQSTSFKGLPTPANAIAVISIVIAAYYSDMPLLKTLSTSPAFLGIYTVVLSILMVTRIPLISLKIKSPSLRGNEGRYILAGLVIISFLVFGIAAAPLIIPLYFISSFVSRLF